MPHTKKRYGPKRPKEQPDTLAGRVGVLVREARLAADLTQAELAERACVDRARLVQLEGGHNLARLDTLERLAAILDVPLKELVP